MLENQKVIHKKLGKGTILALENGLLTIRFGDAEKKLVYPLAFNMGLSLCDEVLMQQIQPEVDKDIAHLAEKKRREERFYRDKASTIKKNSSIAEDAKQARIPAGNVAFKCSIDDTVKSWNLSAGVDQKTGKVRRLMQIQAGKLCILTTQDPEDKETDRYIFAMFMIDEAAAQSGKLQGIVSPGEAVKKLWLQPEEAKTLRFWNYYATKSGRPAWGSGVFRYLHDEAIYRLLEDIVALKNGTAEQQTAQELLEVYRQNNPMVGK